MSDRPIPVKRARTLRRNSTGAEQLLWLNLRNRRLMNLKFLRQHPFIYQVIDNEPRYFVVDFYCAEKSLVIEVDGMIHEYQKEDDEHREEILKSMGITVLRIKNEEVADIHKVLEKIKRYINELTPFAPVGALAPLFRKRGARPRDFGVGGELETR